MPETVSLLDATLEILTAAISGDTTLAAATGAQVATGWLDFPDALPAVHRQYADRGSLAPWGTLFFLLDNPRTVIGWGGFKGSPGADGSVEIGYALAPGFRGRGLAKALARAMLVRAFAVPEVTAITAQTLGVRNASTGVLEHLGFTRTGSSVDPEHGEIWAWRLSRHPLPL